MNNIFLPKNILVLLAVFVPASFASAHVKWFVGDSAPLAEPEYAAFVFLAWFALFCALVGAAFAIERKTATLPLFRDSLVGARGADIVFFVFSFVVGVFLIFSSLQGYVFSLNITGSGPAFAFLLALQSFIGFGFLFGIQVRFSAILLGVLWTLSLFIVGVVPVAENAWVLGVAGFLFFSERHFALISKPLPVFENVRKRYASYALPVLRICLGVTLMILGFTEKLLAPELGIAFLAEHDWNFMYLLGLEWFSDYLFVISAGVVEFLFGFLFFWGLVNRLNGLVVTITFLIPLFILGPLELVGHMPHFAIVGVLFVLGGGTPLYPAVRNMFRA